MAAISFIDSSTLPCSPEQTKPSCVPKKRGEQHTKCLNLLRSALNSQLYLSNLTHLEARAGVSARLWRIGRERLTDKVCRFGVFLGRFFQPPLRGSNAAVAFVHKGKNVVLVFRLEFGEDRVARVGFAGSEKLSLQAFGV